MELQEEDWERSNMVINFASKLIRILNNPPFMNKKIVIQKEERLLILKKVKPLIKERKPFEG